MSDKIRVYRQYITHKMIDAKTMEVISHYYLWIPKEKDVWIYAMDGYLPSLEVKNSDNVNLPILSDDELNFLIQNPTQKTIGIPPAEIITQQVLHEEIVKQIGIISSQPVKNEEKIAKHYVGIILPKSSADHFDEIILKWIKPIEIQKKTNDLLSLQISGEHEVGKTTTASTYIDLQMDEKKYEFHNEPSITVTDESKVERIATCDDIKEVFKSKKRCVYRIHRNNKLNFSIRWSIGIPRLVQRWAWGGFLASIGIIAISILTFVFGDESINARFQESVKLLAGLAGLIVGFRVLLFHDTDLMNRWNHLYLLLLGITLGLVLSMYGYITFT